MIYLEGLKPAVAVLTDNGGAGEINSRIKIIKVRSQETQNKELPHNGMYFSFGSLNHYGAEAKEQDLPI